ncbi:MAG: phosphate ABC transporter substrate-binding/OmpA family protein [Candidatus Eremiobacteraeota bacterium]|nr:phosphate ABC transporter substrate-binding/OmpA family protein [Candidatus Eremiobacteraeota bacterium]
MASKYGRCTNFGSCTKADTKEQIPVGGPDAVCPECGKPLTPVAAPSRGFAGIGIVILLGLVVVIVAGFVYLRGGKGSTAATPAPVAQASTPGAAAPGAPASTTAMRLCGSNTIGSQLGPELIKGYLTKRGGTQIAQRDDGQDQRVVTASLGGAEQQVPIAAHGSATAFTGLLANACDIGMASRAIKPAEARRLRSLGDMTSRANEHVIGLDGIAVIVNPANPVDALTIDQLRKIYTGAVGDWKGVGGKPGRITVYARDAKSGTYDTFSNLVLGKAALIGSAKRFEDSRTLAEAVSRNPSAIGFVGLPYATGAKALKVASGGIAILPNSLTVGRETYPLTRRLYLYTAANPSNAQVRPFIDYVQSSDGQRIVEQNGFVGSIIDAVSASAPPVSVPAGAPREYANIVRTSEQLPFNFYFRTGSDVLDNKAFVDVGRLVSIAGLKRNAGRKVILVGFADSTGTHDANLVLSKGRAESVRRELISQGVEVKRATGFGDALPIRDNATEDGRQKNRRVEIFLSR